MNFFINGDTVILNKGNGIFVNSNRLHFGYSEDMKDCTFIVIVIHPELLSNRASLAIQYWDNKFGSNKDDYVLLTDQMVWQQEVLIAIKNLYDEMHSASKQNPLRLLSQATALCAIMGDHLSEKAEQYNRDQIWTNIWKMTAFIHQNYEFKITLDDIATAGAVCRSRCFQFFKEYVGQTPNSYLTRYRIQKSRELLTETKRSISEIAIACGFQSASYFTLTFRKETGLTPQAYRKQLLQNSTQV
ncbi:AraC family transcriptional regulator [Paenibacillus sp. JCM 10914]|uniref:AraC family transcriptional regulator n=1 Tax=Paenibacillus sp. JCM 10914 TaxID=1236974 RepID=UPI000A64F7AA|nr:AraC family transcriptional regulator [Paenibacillus sp. JCM 10914]